jgi:hypothetical protein
MNSSLPASAGMWSFLDADWLMEWDEACWEKGEKVEESRLNQLKPVKYLHLGFDRCLFALRWQLNSSQSS